MTVTTTATFTRNETLVSRFWERASLIAMDHFDPDGLNVLNLAHDNGKYDLPATAKWRELSRQCGVPVGELKRAARALLDKMRKSNEISKLWFETFYR